MSKYWTRKRRLKARRRYWRPEAPIKLETERKFDAEIGFLTMTYTAIYRMHIRRWVEILSGDGLYGIGYDPETKIRISVQ